jgi:hypothetical protein
VAADAKIRNIRNDFQRIEGAEVLFFKDLGFSLFAVCSQQDRVFLEEQFLKRHVLTHNLGLVDKRYIEKAQIYRKQGEELAIDPDSVSRALEIVKDVVTATAQCL